MACKEHFWLTKCHTWFERDRAHVELREIETNETLVEFWDEDVSNAIEDGTFKGKNWHEELINYALENNIWNPPIPSFDNIMELTKEPTCEIVNAIVNMTPTSEEEFFEYIRFIELLGTIAFLVRENQTTMKDLLNILENLK